MSMRGYYSQKTENGLNTARQGGHRRATGSPKKPYGKDVFTQNLERFLDEKLHILANRITEQKAMETDNHQLKAYYKQLMND
jgi:hypothetical protein